MIVFAFALIVILIAADQLLKYAVVKGIELGEVISIIKIGDKRILELTHIRNTGAAWSIMQGKSWFLIGLPVVVLILGSAFLIYKRNSLKKLEVISIAMIIAGGIGNLIDRIRLKEVVDFISFKLINFPIFNFADICVVVGEILLVVYIFFFDKDEAKVKQKAAGSSEEEEEKTDDKNDE